MCSTVIIYKCTLWYVSMVCTMSICYVHDRCAENIVWRDVSHTKWSTCAVRWKDISLRLLALILCSNCSNTFNKVLTTIGGHMLNYFLKSEGSLELAQYPSRMVEAFHCRHDLCTPPPKQTNQPTQSNHTPNITNHPKIPTTLQYK